MSVAAAKTGGSFGAIIVWNTPSASLTLFHLLMLKKADAILILEKLIVNTNALNINTLNTSWRHMKSNNFPMGPSKLTRAIGLMSTVAILFSSSLLYGQPVTFQWAKGYGHFGGGNVGGLQISDATCLAVDDSGNVYFAGKFNSVFNVDFDPNGGIHNRNSSGGRAFVSKLNALGNHIWTRTFGGAGGTAEAIAIDSFGGLLVTGEFQGSADFDPGAGSAIFNSVVQSGYVLKLDLNGNYKWATAFVANTTSIVANSDGDIFVAGYFNGTIDFDPGSSVFNMISVGADGFISRFDSSGNFMVSYKIGGNGGDLIHRVLIDSTDCFFAVGIFTGTIDLDPGIGTFPSTSAGDDDIFFSKYDSSGTIQWGSRIGNAVGMNYVDAAVDQQGNLVVAGSYLSGTIDFDPGPGVFNGSAGNDGDGFLVKINPIGNFIWAKFLQGTGTASITSVFCDRFGNVYSSGQLGNDTDFDPGAGLYNLDPVGQSAMFISKLDSSGNFEWAGISSGEYSDRSKALVVGQDGSIYSSGYYNQQSVSFGFLAASDFDPGLQSYYLVCVGGGDNVYVHKMGQCLPMTSSQIVTACDQYTWSADGQTYYTSGPRSTILTSSLGCDSIANLNLTIHESTDSTLYETACATFTLNGQTYNSSGIYHQNLPNIAGCDSLITLDLTILPVSNHSFSDTSCGSYILNNQTYTQSGVYTQTLTSTNGCDSMLTINLSVNTLSVYTNVSGGTITAVPSGLSYQWFDCNNQLLLNSTTPTFTPTQSGNYAVIATDGFCIDTSDCETVVGLSNGVTEHQVELYPNPNDGSFNLQVSAESIGHRFFISDLTGRPILEGVAESEINRIMLAEMPAGTYFLIIDGHASRFVVLR